jgi:hypothetical protein
LNAAAAGRDQETAASRGPRFLGDTLMETIRPEKSDPIPLRSTSPPVGTIMIRFVGLLIVVIAAMALIWSR